MQLVIFASVGLGSWVGTLTPWLDKTRVGPPMVSAFLQPYVINVLPNLLFLSAIFFALAALSRKMLPVYVASVLVLIGYFVVTQNSNTFQSSVHFALLDPLGGAAIDRMTRYWTPFQRNTQLIPLGGILLANRLVWLGIGAMFFIVAYTRFSFSYVAERSRGKNKTLEDKEILPATQTLAVAHPVFSSLGSLRQLLSLTRIQFIETVKNVFFVVSMLAGYVRGRGRVRRHRSIVYPHLSCNPRDAADRGHELPDLCHRDHHFLFRRAGLARA